MEVKKPMDLENPVKLRLIEGDCIKAMKLIPKKSIGILNTDPPYNIGKNYGDFKFKRLGS